MQLEIEAGSELKLYWREHDAWLIVDPCGAWLIWRGK
jgi:hypothetical protein